jgi:site-specific recombinase XerD
VPSKQRVAGSDPAGRTLFLGLDDRPDLLNGQGDPSIPTKLVGYRLPDWRRGHGEDSIYGDESRKRYEELGKIRLTELTASNVQEALAALAARLSTRTVQIAHNVLVRAIRHAERDDLVGRNVAALVDAPKGQQAGRPSKSLTLEQAVALMTAAKGTALEAYVIVSGPLGKDHNLVFASAVGTAQDDHNVRRPFRVITEAAGLGKAWVPRELRHTFVSLLSAHGVPVEAIALLAGHQQTATTELVYRHQIVPALTRGAEVMDQIFS